MTAGERESYDIVYASDHAYMFCCCVSIYSLMEHMPADRLVRLHLLTDESFCDEDRMLLSRLSGRFSNLCVSLHEVRHEAFEKRDFRDSIWSRAACYRLILPGLLENVNLCLYIDSDTLIVGDITPLWEMDMEAYALAGVFDDISPVRAQTVGNHIPGIQTYINSGVLLMNLKLMRERGIEEQLLSGVSDYLVVDQDLLNVVCYGLIRLLPADYNCIPGVQADSPKILHFLMRDYLRPWKNLRAGGSGSWWRCAQEFAPVYDVESLRASADWYERGSIFYLLRRCADYSGIYIVGSSPDAERIHRALRLGRCKGLQGILDEEDSLPYAEDILLINASRKGTVPVLSPFVEREGARRQVIRYSRWPLAFYNLAPEQVRREINGELLMWEFGVDARNAATSSQLLELNAARYPDREALVEWKDGVRSSCTFRELNRMANRMADWLRKQNTGRGENVALPDRPVRNIERFGAVLGILKGGCLPGQEQAERMADLSVLYDEQYSSMAPLCEALPDEAAMKAGKKILTGRALVRRAEELRRRCGWHAGDRLLLCHRPRMKGPAEGLIEVLGAFAYGNTTVICETDSGEDLLRIAAAQACTIVSMSESSFECVSRDLTEMKEHEGPKEQADGAIEKKSADSCSTLRLCLTRAEDAFTCREGMARETVSPEALARWERAMPQVPVNGQGYAGTFFYDCEWYA